MRRFLSALALAFASLSFSPAQAAGLLQDLFSPPPRPSPIIHAYAPAQPQIRFLFDEGLRVSRRPAAHRKAVTRKHTAKKWSVERRKGSRLAHALSPRFRVDHGRRVNRAHVARLGMRARLATKIHAPAAVAPAQFAPVVAKAATTARIDNDPTLRVGDAYMTTEGLRIYRGPQTKAVQRKAFVDFRSSHLGKGVKSQLAALESAPAHRIRRIGAPALKSIPARASERRSIDRQGRAIRIVGP
ncbi:MAG: hypothetical protein KDA41_00895 [Planctomycetales bacterium]|nr:hypothetical protein [Planctomycetales bacterium]